MAACASGQAKKSQSTGGGGERAEISIERGGNSSTYTIALPRIFGPTADLVLTGGHLRGFLNSQSLDLFVNQSGAKGSGPAGLVNIEVRLEGDQTIVGGMWNGATVKLRLAPGSLQGSVVVARAQTAVRAAFCSYFLDRRQANGSLAGVSTCAGRPEGTQLDVTASVRRALTPVELAVVLVAVLASPPGQGD